MAFRSGTSCFAAERQTRHLGETSNQARKVRSIRKHDVRLESQALLERGLDVAFEVDHLEAVSAQDRHRGSGRRDPHLVTERDEPGRDTARSQGGVEPCARNAVQDPHAEQVVRSGSRNPPPGGPPKSVAVVEGGGAFNRGA
jgi:hypothetical protein